MPIPPVLQRVVGKLNPAYDGNVIHIKDLQDCHSLFEKPFAVLLKYSSACSFSLATFHDVISFYRSSPEMTIHALSVQRARPAAILVEEHTGVCHETPQLLVMRKGVVIAHASHSRITAKFLAAALVKQSELVEP